SHNCQTALSGFATIDTGRTVAEARKLVHRAKRISLLVSLGAGRYSYFTASRSAFIAYLRPMRDDERMPVELQESCYGDRVLWVGNH
ncbi:hypothetical protein, partial [Klebsiella pneumoniae]|uniref:hypothetical protein n=1 Tax=Klebsiella pneumoniae TaxID=573 RepID=UPI00195397C9